jgi:hypothetical protein
VPNCSFPNKWKLYSLYFRTYFLTPQSREWPPCDSCLSHVSCVLKLYAGETDGKDPPLLAFKHYLRNIEFCSNSDIVKNKPHILLFFFLIWWAVGYGGILAPWLTFVKSFPGDWASLNILLPVRQSDYLQVSTSCHEPKAQVWLLKVVPQQTAWSWTFSNDKLWWI